jgi:signal transduction histidine kinase
MTDRGSGSDRGRWAPDGRPGARPNGGRARDRGRTGRRAPGASRGPPWVDAGGERPAWWPDDEPWPRRRRRPWRGFGCLFGLLFLAGVLGLFAFATSVVGHIIDAAGPAAVVVRVAAVGVAGAVVVALLRTGRSIRGSGTVLDALVDQAARVEAGDYAARVDPVGPVPPPVRALARGFNTMAARLAADEAQRRSLLADVTHELRTPLTVVQGSVEAILDGIHPADEAHLTAILEETRVLGRLVEDLRTLALSEAGSLSLHREPTDLGILAADVATSFAAAADAGRVRVATAVDDDVPLLDVDPVRIREVIANLVANAIRHTPAGGRIEIAATRSDGAAAVAIVVRDTGPGIDPELLPHVFDRFARGTGSPGSGLGLSIARGLVELHGGTISAGRASQTGGTEIRIELPVHGPSAGD